VAVGGGSEDKGGWSDKPYRYIVDRSINKKIVIISDDSPSDSSWLPNYFKSLGAEEAYNFYIPTKAFANLESTAEIIKSAGAVFIRGGDQWIYTNLWKVTLVEDAIREVFNNGGVVAGTSAGAMVLGDLVFTASQYSSIDSEDALNNPFSSGVKLEDDFLKLTPNVIFDTHFIERGRFGRLMAFLYNFHFSTGRDVIGIGIDDRTAVAISPDLIAEVMGSGTVTFFQKDELTNYIRTADGYVIDNLKADLLVEGWKWNIAEKKIYSMPESAKPFSSNVNTPVNDFKIFNLPINSAADKLLSEITSEDSVLIINDNKSSQSADIIKNKFASAGINSESFEINSASLNDPTESAKFLKKKKLIFITEYAENILQLADTNYTASKNLKERITGKSDLFFIGKSGKLAGSYFVGNTDIDKLAAYKGRMNIYAGLGLYDNVIIQPDIFSNGDYEENWSSSIPFGLMKARKNIGLYYNDRADISINSKSIKNSEKTFWGIIDSQSSTFTDSSKWKMSSSSTRQSVAFDNLRYSYSKSSYSFNLETRRMDFESSIDRVENSKIPNEYRLEQNFPNPFNPSTTIEYYLPKPGSVKLEIYNTLGQLVNILVEANQNKGAYKVTWNGKDSQGNTLSSGVYFYRLKTNEYSNANKMLLLK
jgi:cyanophycinase